MDSAPAVFVLAESQSFLDPGNELVDPGPQQDVRLHPGELGKPAGHDGLPCRQVLVQLERKAVARVVVRDVGDQRDVERRHVRGQLGIRLEAQPLDIRQSCQIREHVHRFRASGADEDNRPVGARKRDVLDQTEVDLGGEEVPDEAQDGPGELPHFGRCSHRVRCGLEVMEVTHVGDHVSVRVDEAFAPVQLPRGGEHELRPLSGALVFGRKERTPPRIRAHLFRIVVHAVVDHELLGALACHARRARIVEPENDRLRKAPHGAPEENRIDPAVDRIGEAVLLAPREQVQRLADANARQHGFARNEPPRE